MCQGQNVTFELSHFFQEEYCYCGIPLKLYFFPPLLCIHFDSKIKFYNDFEDFAHISNDFEVGDGI